MPIIQRNKRFGLMKLKKIAGKPNKNWYISPHITLKKSQYTLTKNKINNASRLLVRTDEKGKKYSKQSYETMPRDDIRTTNWEKNPITNEEINLEINRINRFSKSIPIIHPTRNRTDIQWTGRILLMPKNIFRSRAIARIYLSINPQHKPVHRLLHSTVKIDIPLKNNKLQTIKTKYPPLENQPQAEAIIKKIVAFVNRGIITKQINPKRPHNEISFLTWKDKPTTLEIFDFIEQREVPKNNLEKPKQNK